jgi:uncharacterized protein
MLEYSLKYLPEALMSDMIEVAIDSIRVSLMSQQRIVILREKNAERYLPIWIGVYEAEAITIALQEVEVARPLTHDLLNGLFTQLDARILRVEVVALRDETFFGNIVVEKNGQTINIDSRPSDALAIAVRAHVPILVAHSVMESAGIVPEEDLQEQEQQPSARPASAASPTNLPASASTPTPVPAEEEGDDRLSVFSDFLAGLDLGDSDDEEGEENKKQ